ncbi:hypothetical protein B0T21DRAFT_288116 [Apiosordaria backusii]|uniref:Macro domain-containing protein n=1 Tax=Apiosordaria backusii TaxID=314023 RepID=A0AA40EF69_9PEZI|nr:hypothetical protein B0T21DRAFT_288116 [Apiosordaria backusii]
MTILEAADIPSVSLLYKLHKLSAAPAGTKLVPTLLGPTEIPRPSKSLNDRVAVYRADITSLAVDAIVNAANRSLLGGGGVDGAIHRAAGPELYQECKTLNGCKTGSAKITEAYNLPCKRVIHAVGPIYDPLEHDKSEQLLVGCYTRSLELAVENKCRTIAFSALSTGVYGYPSREAAPAALSAIRHFLTGKDGDQIDKVILVTFEKKDVDAYTEFVPHYFPPVAEDASSKTDDQETREQLDAEADAVAQELPSAPTSNPVDPEEANKR